MTAAETTVITAGIVIVTVVVTEARTVITMVATGTGAIAVALLQRVAGIRLTTGVAKVTREALRVSGALPAVPTEEITKLLLPTRLLKRLRAGKGSESMDWYGCRICFLFALPLFAFIFFLFLLISNSPANDLLRLLEAAIVTSGCFVACQRGVCEDVDRTRKQDMRKSYILKIIIRTRLKKEASSRSSFVKTLQFPFLPSLSSRLQALFQVVKFQVAPLRRW
jgi:hypothetical protein